MSYETIELYFAKILTEFVLGIFIQNKIVYH